MDLMGLMRKYTNFMNRKSPQQPNVESNEQPFRETPSTTTSSTTMISTMTNTYSKLTESKEIKLNLQKIAIKKSGLVMELLGFKKNSTRNF